tara:strand:- start:44 stop:568 length:525 start_codon:yes stop_codon:yes gene_type:complete
MPKPIRKARKIRRSYGGPGGGGVQPPRHPPGIQQGPRKQLKPYPHRVRKPGPKPDVITSTKFETLTNQQNTNVSQYAAPEGFVQMGYTDSGPIYFNQAAAEKLKQQKIQQAYDRRQELRNNAGKLTGDYRMIVPPNSNLGRLPDGSPYNPNLAYEFDGKGGYRIVKDYGLGELP